MIDMPMADAIPPLLAWCIRPCYNVTDSFGRKQLLHVQRITAVSDTAVSDTAVSDTAVSDTAVSDIADSDIAVSVAANSVIAIHCIE